MEKLNRDGDQTTADGTFPQRARRRIARLKRAAEATTEGLGLAGDAKYDILGVMGTTEQPTNQGKSGIAQRVTETGEIETAKHPSSPPESR